MAKTKKYSSSQVRRMLADKNQRAKLPDRYLTPDLLARRRRAQADKADPLSATLRKESEAAARTEFDPQYDDIAKAEKASDQSRSNLDAWFQQYLDQQKDVQARSAGAYTQAQGQIQGMDQQMAQKDAQGVQALAAGGQALGQKLGGGGDLLQAGLAQKASLARQALNDSFAARLASESVTQGNFLRDRESIVGRQRVDELGKEQARRTELGTQRSKLGQKRRDYLAKFTSEGRDAARKAQLEEAAFGLKQTDQAQDVKDKAAARRIDRARLDVTTRGQDISSADRAADRAARGKGKGKKPTRGLGSATRDKERTHISDIESAVLLIRQAPVGQKGGPTDDTQLREALRTGKTPSGATLSKPYKKELVNAAMDLARLGYLSPANVKVLHDLGVHIPVAWRKKQSADKRVARTLPRGQVKF